MAKRIVELAIELTGGVYNLFGIRCDDTTSTPVPLPLAGAMLGMVVPVVINSASLPAYLLPCDGSSHLRTDYPDLYAVLASEFITDADHFITPDLRGRTPIGANGTYPVGSAGGEAAHTLTSGEMPSHTHTIGPHNHGVTDPGHNHTQNAHNHGVTDSGHTHTIAHTHDVTLRNSSSAGTTAKAMAASGTGTGDGTETTSAVSAANSGSNTTGISTNNATPTNNSNTTGISINLAGLGPDNTGGGGAHNNMQPYRALNFAVVALVG